LLLNSELTRRSKSNNFSITARNLPSDAEESSEFRGWFVVDEFGEEPSSFFRLEELTAAPSRSTWIAINFYFICISIINYWDKQIDFMKNLPDAFQLIGISENDSIDTHIFT
jgi:hypothetical protein